MTRIWSLVGGRVGVSALLVVGLVCGSPDISRGATITVNAGGNLQTALNAAQPGDTILLEPGATFTGNFTLPAKSGDAFITIRSAAPDAVLPGPGVRTSPAYAQYLPTIVTPNTAPAIQAPIYSHHWRIENVRFAATGYVYNLIALGSTEGLQNAAEKIPHHIVLDRIYVDIDGTKELRRAVMLNANSAQVVNSYIVGIKDSGFDCQAVWGWNAHGPFLIENNTLEASGENLGFGGADPDIVDLVPSDITIRRNHVYKRWAWCAYRPEFGGVRYVAKNLIEFKTGRHILIEGNLFENNWDGFSQAGFAVVLTVRNDVSGLCPWNVIEDLTFRNNIVRHTARGINILSHDDGGMPTGSSQAVRRTTIHNNLFYDLSASAYGADNGHFMQMVTGGGSGHTTGAEGVTVSHNTVINAGSILIMGTEPQKQLNVVIANNIFRHNFYGILKGGLGVGDRAIDGGFEVPHSVTGNVLATDDTSIPPMYSLHAGNIFPGVATLNDSFVNPLGQNFRLKETSPFKKSGTDGLDRGANIDQIEAAIAGAATPPAWPTNVRIVG